MFSLDFLFSLTMGSSQEFKFNLNMDFGESDFFNYKHLNKF